jgi:hypothetical protein
MNFKIYVLHLNYLTVISSSIHIYLLIVQYFEVNFYSEKLMFLDNQFYLHSRKR